ncbi:MAG: hypothetical protein CMJ98_06185 [Planctomycetes bacterium]|jgi:arylsulfatase A-like enzyme|nr:hypothetical protein [Planctomycetota bacterium]HJM56763.1 sulfatase-like hydrolase/transferase [Planctomycetota bacterium]
MYHVQTYKAWVLVLAAAATLPCSLKATPPAEGAAPNIVLVVLDDVGTDRLAFYGEGPTPAPTPQLSALAAGGVVFTNAWGSATCTPARAMINTGQYGIHSGIGSNPDQGGGDGLPLNAQILPECLSGKYTSVAVGKWHLGDDGQGPYHPNDSGYALYSGSLKNLNSNPTAEDYFNWQHTINGTTSWKSVYAPTVNINDSVRAVGNLQEPFFLYLNFNSIHTPLHEPPANLHTQTNLPPDPNDDPIAYVNAMAEAMDTELGRLLAVLPANTYVIIVGDNGPLGQAVEPPLDPNRVKGTMYQGGLRVPLLISGPGVVPGQADALVSVVDLLATVLELSGVKDLPKSDSVSLVPYLANTGLSLRSYVYSDRFRPNGKNVQYTFRTRAVRDHRYKLIRRLTSPDEFYDLQADPYERTNLIAGGLTTGERAAYGRLSFYMEDL